MTPTTRLAPAWFAALAPTFASFVPLALALAGCGNLDDVSTSVDGVGYTPDGTLVIYTPAGIKLYDATLAHERKSIVLDAQPGGVLADEPIAFDLSADGTVAAVGYSNTITNDVSLFEIPGGGRRISIDATMPGVAQEFPTQGVFVSPTGALVYIQGPASGVYDGGDGTRLWGSDDGTWLHSVRFSADESTLFGYSVADLQIKAFEARTGALKFSVDAGGGGTIAAMGLSPDGATIVTSVTSCSEATTIPGYCSDGGTWLQTYVFRSAADGTETHELPAFPGTFAAGERVTGAGGIVCTAASGGLCAVQALGDDGASMALVFGLDGTLVRSFAGPVRALAFSPDGALLAVAGGDARVFRLEDGALLAARTYTYGVF